ncbi:MAG: 2'-5' RNA ligase family protein [Arenicellales bacterium]|nr:2'-5' RNA ligase family protein [Arenicellales bacterium]
MKALYYIAVVLPSAQADAVKALQHRAHTAYHSRAALRSPPHITLRAPFRLPLDQVGGLKQVLTEFASSYTPFSIELGGFGCFPPRVVFVRVIENQALSLIQHDLIKTLTEHQIVGSGEQVLRAFHPHVTIAFRDLIQRHFRSLWGEVEHKSFVDRFTAGGITLLRHDGKIWTAEADFLFGQKEFDART